jgi:hypothetical protein
MISVSEANAEAGRRRVEVVLAVAGGAALLGSALQRQEKQCAPDPVTARIC